MTARSPIMQPYTPGRKRAILSWVITLVAALAVALCIRFFVFEFVRIDGPSMEPTLYTDEYVFVDKISYQFSQPQRGDIVIIDYPGGTEPLSKRVIGVSGDTLALRSGVLYLNGQADFEYFSGTISGSFQPLTIPEGTVYVMGDNRNDSRDSRDPAVGALPVSNIRGKALFILWPPGRIGGF